MSHHMTIVDKRDGEQRENSIEPHSHSVQNPRMWETEN